MNNKVAPLEVVSVLLVKCDGFREKATPLIQEGEKLLQLENPSEAEEARMEQIQLEVSELARITLLSRGITTVIYEEAPAGESRQCRESTEDALEELIPLSEIHHDDRLATARAEMFFTPWSHQFVHGSETLLPVVKLAEKLLTPTEKIKTLKKITWRKPATNNLRIGLIAGDVSGQDNGNYCFDGKFTTTAGRILSFFGMEEKDDPIRGARDFNPYAQGAICHSPKHISKVDDCYQLEIHDTLPEQDLAILESSPALKIATLVEIITLGLARLRHVIPDVEDSQLSLMGGISGLIIPISMRNFFGKDATLELKIFMEKVEEEYKNRKKLN